jgi:molecular chaperone GrpE
MAREEAERAAEKEAEKEAEKRAAGNGSGDASPEVNEAEQPGAGEEPGVDELEARVTEAVEVALAEQRETLLRAQAEMQNMRRRCEQDVEKAHKFALEKFGAELLSVVDNLERALQAAPEQRDEGLQALHEGVELTLKSFVETLNKFNIEQINPEGEPFDPQRHEAMTTQVNDEVEPNTVVEVVQKGYTLNGRVIRPARVIVSKAGQQGSA